MIASLIEKSSGNYESVLISIKKNSLTRILFILLFIALTLFSGLRTGYNDTSAYTHKFIIDDFNHVTLGTLTENYGGFDIFQFLIKRFISDNPQALLITYSIIVNAIFLWFFAKYSKHFTLTIFSYFILGPYVFSMAAIKQIIAMSISLIAIDRMLNKKYIRFVLFILLAATFHPYIICLFMLPFLKDGLLNRKTLWIILITIIISSNLELLLNIAATVGKNYSTENLTENTINPFRVAVELVPVIFIIANHKKLNTVENPIFILGSNMLLISVALITMGLFFNPIYFGRIATYFSPLVAITIPIMLSEISDTPQNRVLNTIVYYTIFITYFFMDLTKLGSIPFSTDLFKHINIF
jgi:hypothetical protein